MPNYFYVKSGGTADGSTVDASGTNGVSNTLLTGAFSSIPDTFDTILDACAANTISADHGDFIVISDAHSESSTATINLIDRSLSRTDTDKALVFLTVDDANCDTYKRSTTANITTTTGASINIAGGSADNCILEFWGIFFESSDNVTSGAGGSLGCESKYTECTFRVTGNSDIAFSSSSPYPHYRCTFRADSTSASYFLSGCGRYYDCDFTTDQSSKSVPLIFRINPAGCFFYNCDISGSKVDALYSLDNGRGPVTLYMHNCAVPSEMVSYPDGTYNTTAHDLFLKNSSATAACAEYQYYYENIQGRSVEDETNVYRNDSTAFPSGQKISLHASVNASCSPGSVFNFDLPTRYAALSSTNTVTVYLLSETGDLTDEEVYVTLVGQDGTNKELPISQLSHSPIVLQSGAALSTTGVSASDWTHNLTSPTAYKIETTLTSPADSVPAIRITIARPSVDIYLCPTISLS